MRQIVGIGLYRDEDIFVERVVQNVLDFCDVFIAVDHRSRDETPQILAQLARANERMLVQRVDRAGKANEFLRRYVGQDVWVLGVDGDELYEPERLRPLRARLLAGEFDEWYLIKGNVLHCDELDALAGTAGGWLAPPSRSITKLFNFAALERWEGRALEHLYGGTRTFRPGYSGESIYYLRDEYDWASSPFRCLHVCFLPRSTRQPPRQQTRRSLPEWGGEPRARRAIGRLGTLVGRPPLPEWGGGEARARRAIGRLGTLVGRPPESGWKLAKYRQGPRVEVGDVADFFGDGRSRRNICRRNGDA